MRNGLDIYKGHSSLFNAMSDFERMFEDAIVNPWTLVGRTNVTDREWFDPRVDIQENEDAYFLNVDIPGVRKEDLKLDINGRILTISGERKREGGSARMHGKFTRSFTLPEMVDAGKIEAKLEDGVLAVALPKAEAAKPRTIEIGVGKPGLFSKLVGGNKKSDTASDSAESH